MFPTLCDICYDDVGATSKSEQYRLSRTVSPSSIVSTNVLAPYLLTGQLNSRCSPSPDLVSRHSVAGAGARKMITPSNSPTRRSKTTIGNYHDGIDRPSPPPFSSALGMIADDRVFHSRSKTTLRQDHYRSTDENDEFDGEKLIWVDSLKKWVVEDSDNMPYFSFVNTAMLQARASTRSQSNREKSTASVYLSGRFQEKSTTEDPEKHVRLRRGFIPPRKPPPKAPTTFISANPKADQRPSKTILRQKIQNSGDRHSSSRSTHGRLSASGSHRVHFVDERNEGDANDIRNTLLDQFEMQAAKGFEPISHDDGSASDQQSRTDSAFESANESRLSISEFEDVANEWESRDHLKDNVVTDSDGRVSTDDPKHVSAAEKSELLPDNLFDSADNNSNLSSLANDTALNKQFETLRELPEQQLKVMLNHSIQQGNSSNKKDGKARRHKGDLFRRGSGGGDVFDHRDQLTSDSVEKNYNDDALKVAASASRTEVPAEVDPSLLVTKEIASVRLDHPPHLELVVDSESKGAVADTRRSKPIKRQRQLRKAIHHFPAPTKPAPQLQSRKTGWLFTDDLTEQPEPEEEVQIELDEPKVFEAPPLPVYRTPTPPRTPTPEEAVRDTEIPLVRRRRPPPKPRWGPKRRDQSYMNDLKDAERRERARQLVNKMWVKDKTKTMGDCGVKDAPRFEQYGFLAKYCILNRTSVEMFRRTFDAVDDEQKGWLSYQETLIGLRGVNQKLKDAEEKYLYRVLELCGYNVRRGADFKLFAVLSALSQKITSLDGWMRNLIGRMDFKMLEMKMFLCKHLWECNVDRETNRISIEQLCVELRAGGVTEKHIDEVRQRLGWMRALDLLDFLTYIPLFIMLHTSIVDNPLDMSRTK